MAKHIELIITKADNGFIIKIPDNSLISMVGEKKDKLTIAKDKKEALAEIEKILELI